MAIKVDFEKAYEKLEWSFIHKVLQTFHFPQDLIKVIMSCVSSTSILVMVDGGCFWALCPLERNQKRGPFIPVHTHPLHGTPGTPY